MYYKWALLFFLFRRFETQDWSHYWHKLQAAESGKQVLPSLKEVTAWGDVKNMKETSTIYLELIPEKPNSKDTLLHALFKIEDLFVLKLGYKYVVVCGDGLTVQMLYKIQDEYGTSLKWLQIMLGTWHTMKDYLKIFCQKYRHAFLEPVLRTHFTGKGTLEGILGASSWDKSHRFIGAVMEALIRHFLETFAQSGSTEPDKIEKLRNSALVSN